MQCEQYTVKYTWTLCPNTVKTKMVETCVVMHVHNTIWRNCPIQLSPWLSSAYTSNIMYALKLIVMNHVHEAKTFTIDAYTVAHQHILLYRGTV